MHDVFISYASEDKVDVARPLATALRQAGLDVWFDEFILKAGDSLHDKIETGLASSRFGVIILSPNFLKKNWTKFELDGLITKEMEFGKTILPVWHNLSRRALTRKWPALAGRVGVPTSKGIEATANQILAAIRAARSPVSKSKARNSKSVHSAPKEREVKIKVNLTNNGMFSRSFEATITIIMEHFLRFKISPAIIGASYYLSIDNREILNEKISFLIPGSFNKSFEIEGVEGRLSLKGGAGVVFGGIWIGEQKIYSL
jgi:hypothetical protein